MAGAVQARAPRLTVAETRRAVRDAAQAVDPVSAAERHRRARRARSISWSVLPDGMDPGTPRNVCLTATGQTATPVEQIIQEGGSLLEVHAGVDPADLQLPSPPGPIP